MGVENKIAEILLSAVAVSRNQEIDKKNYHMAYLITVSTNFKSTKLEIDGMASLDLLILQKLEINC